eukprot:gene9527-1733_t
MKNVNFVCLVLLLLLSSCFSQTQKGVVYLNGTTGNTGISGIVTFSYDGANTTISGTISGLAVNSIHGIHVHQFGDISKTDGTGTGGHWNPYSGVHGFLTQNNSHAGDLGNITADGTGVATFTIVSTKIKLNGNDSAIGKGMILHSNFDDGVTQPTGNAGSRLAQGVIGIKNEVNNNATSEKNSFAVCELIGVYGAPYGRVLFTQNADSTVRVQAEICSLSQNDHGFHIHQFGDLSGTDISTNTGGHFNPTGASHAYPPSPNRHYGDMGNLTVINTIGKYDAKLDLLTLNGVNSIVGRAVVVHSGADDGTGATGNAGSKVATCVIGAVDTLPSLVTCPVPLTPETVYYGQGAVLLEGTAGNEGVKGKVYFNYSSGTKSTTVTGTISGLAANSVHGFHVHQYGDLSKSDGTGTGGHWNPTSGTHGYPNFAGRHAGDLGNITADATGVAIVNVVTDKLTMFGNESAIGKGVVLHAQADDGVTQPTGNAGSRLAQGVIGIQNIGNNNATAYQDSFAVCEFKSVSGSSPFGRILFTQNGGGTVRVQAKICGMTPNGQNGFHVHEFGDLTGTDRSTNTGGHWNPTGATHAYPPTATRHYGDMGNIVADANGAGNYDANLDLLTLVGSNSIVGRAVVIHSGKDDGTGTTGNAGSKLGTCVIGSVATLPSLVTCPAPFAYGSVLIKGTEGNSGITGKLFLNYYSTGLETIITGTISGLPANSIHGMHIHQYGDISKTDGTGTGGHWNPFGGVHGPLTLSNRHAGDLGNITADATGTATVSIVSDKVSLLSNISAIGRAIIIHAKPDDGVSQPTGNAGSRLAQGIIGIQNVVNNNATSDQHTYAVCQFSGVSPSVYGQIHFTQNQDSTVTVQAEICGLSPNAQNGFHVHQFGDQTGSDVTTNVGGHWNPTGASHAYPPSPNRHFGDMGNITANTYGIAKINQKFDLLTLNGKYSIIGRAIVLHAGADDGTGASGNAGSKLGSCVIGTVNSLPTLSQCPESDKRGIVLMEGTQGNENIRGTIELNYFSKTNITTVSGSISGLAANSIHAIHVHQYGDLSKKDGTSTGGHWNPSGGVHGLLTATNSHAGDLGNITADATGKATFSFVSSKLLLSGADSAIGKGMIVHSGSDDGVSQPTGNAGSRIAAGVIGIKNVPKNNATSEKNSFAVCEFEGEDAPSIHFGRILFTENGGTVRVQARICGMSPSSSNGFHIHEFGDITGSTITANVGGHWNPTGASHAYPPSPNRHYGDMGNLTTDADGVGSYDSTLDLLTLNGINSIVGRAVVVHDLKDDGTGATGNAGTKFGTCVIGTVATLPAFQTCPTYDASAAVLLTGTENNDKVSGILNLNYNVNKNSTTIVGTILGLEPNSVHAIHVHKYGDISKKDGTGTGGHWNPYGGIHGPLTLSNRHAGDLGNITANSVGAASVNIVSNLVLLEGNNSAIGKAIIVHSGSDDGISQPTGNAGSRLAQGVIGIKSGSNNNATSTVNQKAVCEFKHPTDKYTYGRILFEQNVDETVTVTAFICGLPANTQHGFHVHNFGDLTGTDITSNTGNHFNPTGAIHGQPPTNNYRHYGDMGNITTNRLGFTTINKRFNLLSLTGKYSIVGRSVVVHESGDNAQGTTGNSGKKVGTCVIGTVDTFPLLDTVSLC